MINEDDLKGDFNELCNSINELIEARNFELALDLISLAASSAYSFFFLSEFYNSKLEDYLELIANLNFKPQEYLGNENKIIFYDYFGFDNRGLTQQYLRSLMKLDLEIIYVLEQSNNAYSSSDIFKELNDYGKYKIYRIKAGNYLNKIAEVLNIIKLEKPSKAFLHLAPWDVVACIAFYLIKTITRYQINLTDHAFWLGKNITDVSLEFRSFGYNASNQLRKLNKHKLRILPYYPILNNHPFEGLPNTNKNNKIIFSGGSAYKILGEKLEFLNIVKELLDIDERLIFMFAGTGNLGPIKNFIRDNKLEERFLLLGDRKDISAVIKHVDYYISTFPFTGCLISQIAASQGVPSFFFSTNKYQCNDIKDLFLKTDDLEQFENKNSLIARFKEVYNDNSFLKSYGIKLINSIITSDEMAQGLTEILKGNDPYDKLKCDYDVSNHIKVSSSFLLESENLYNPQYKSLVCSVLPNAHYRRKYIHSFYRREQLENLKSNKIQYFKNIIRAFILKK